MLKKLLPLLILSLFGVFQSTHASDHTLVSTSIQSGASNVQLNTRIKFTFSHALQTIPDLEVALEGIFPMPADKIEVTGFRFLDNNKSIEFDVQHESNADYYWMVYDVLFADGVALASNQVVWYTTSSQVSNTTIYGQVDIINLQFKGEPQLQSSSFRRKGFKSSGDLSIAQETMFNLKKSMILLSQERIDDIEEADPRIFIAAAHADENGAYTVHNIKSGTYYVYGILVDELSFAAGLYDLDGDFEADAIVIDNMGSGYEANFSMFGFSSFQPGKFAADTYYHEVLESAREEYSDAVLMHISSSEFIEDRNGSGKLYNTGKTYLWMYTFYSPSEDKSFMILNSPFYSLVLPADNHLHDRPMSQINPVGLGQFNSENIAHYAYAYVGSQFIDGLPDDAEIYVQYELSRATHKYPNVFHQTNVPYWEVYYQGSYMNQFGEGFYKEATLLIHAETGVLLYSSTTTSVDDNGEQLPSQFDLSQNYPNPFNPSTSISFTIPESGAVTLAVYDLLGRQVAVLADGTFPAGSHSVNWNANHMASGVYLYRLEMGSQTQLRKMTLAK